MDLLSKLCQRLQRHAAARETYSCLRFLGVRFSAFGLGIGAWGIRGLRVGVSGLWSRALGLRLWAEGIGVQVPGVEGSR